MDSRRSRTVPSRLSSSPHSSEESEGGFHFRSIESPRRPSRKIGSATAQHSAIDTGVEEEEAEYNPRSFPYNIKQACWEKAPKVKGRDPDRWRRDALGNIVFRKLVGCPGCLCHDYDHIVPYSKGGKSTIDNCQVLQAAANRAKGNHTDMSNTDLVQKSAYCRVSGKCQMLTTSRKLLGHIICKGGLMVDPVKVRVILELESPLNLSQVKKFVGHNGYYRKFIKGFEKIANPLEKLLGKDGPFLWVEKC